MAVAEPAGSARGRAFGLELRGDFPAPGLWRGAAAGARGAELRIVPPEALASGAGERIWVHRFGAGGPTLTLDRAAEGYLMAVEGWGRYRVSADGRVVLLAPPRRARWRWQRLLTAQVLPLAALAQGLELLHAGAVSLGGRVVAFAGAGGAGKTTLTAHLALGGARIVTDDVLALEPAAGGGLVAHPGPALVNLRHDTAAMLGTGRVERLGTLVGSDAGALRLQVEREERPLGLGALYFLERTAGPAAEPRIEPLRAPDPRRLLGSCFNAALRTPARLAVGLDVCARLAGVPVFVVRAPSGDPSRLAATVRAHAEAVVC